MWHVKIVDGVLKQEPGPLEPGASSRSLAEFVSHALAAEPGWCSAEAGLFEVEDVSGCGGSKTYQVAATHVYSPQLRPSSVALHCRLKPIMDRSSYFPRRMAAATRVFSASGLGPRRATAGTSTSGQPASPATSVDIAFGTRGGDRVPLRNGRRSENCLLMFTNCRAIGSRGPGRRSSLPTRGWRRSHAPATSGVTLQACTTRKKCSAL